MFVKKKQKLFDFNEWVSEKGGKKLTFLNDWKDNSQLLEVEIKLIQMMKKHEFVNVVTDFNLWNDM